MALIILIAVFGGVIWLLMRQWLKTASEEDKKNLRKLVIWTVAIAGLIALILTGRLFHALGWAIMVLIVLLISGTLAAKRRRETPRLSNMSGPMTIKKAHKILNLKEGASKKAIQSAYIELIKQHHPDNGGNQDMSALLNEAYDVLMDPNRWDKNELKD